MSKRTWWRERKKETGSEENARIKRKYGCTRKVWYRAKRLQTKYFGDDLWLVWGGENQHIVYYSPTQRTCDCKGQADAYDQVCSHTQAVKNRIQKVIGGKT